MKKFLLLLLTLCMVFGAVSCAKEPSASFEQPVVIKGVKISLDDEAKDILPAMGALIDYDETPTCNYEGMDKTYVYNGVQLETYTMKNIEYVRKILLLDDSSETPEGLRVGASEETVTELYGEPTEKFDGGYRYDDKKDSNRLEIGLRDGKVTYVLYCKIEGNKKN